MHGWKTAYKPIHDKGEYYREDKEEEKGEEVNRCIFRRKKPVAVVLPSSILANESSLREKTYKFVYILRSLVMFRVDELVVYIDKRHDSKDIELMRLLYRYYMTPPYLRKKVIPLNPLLRYVGCAPPLRMLIHDVKPFLRSNEFRQVYVLKVYDKCFVADAGLNREVLVKCNKYCPEEGEIVVVKVIEHNDKKEIIYDRGLAEKVYQGPNLTIEKDLLSIIKTYRSRGFYIIATSRLGEKVNHGLLNKLAWILKRYNGLALLFGSPYRGLYDIMYSDYNEDLNKYVDIVLNTVVNQGVKTVRTEEAIITTLSLINIIID